MKNNTVDNITDIYPQSPLQKGMIFHMLSDPLSEAYIIQITLDLDGNVNIDALKQAWQGVIDYYDVLRTGFEWEDLDEPLQCIYRVATPEWIVNYWQDLSTNDQELEWKRIIEQDRRQRFDLTTPPLMRFHLVKLSNMHFRLLWSSHHILLDGWSTPLVINQMLKAYEFICKNQPIVFGRKHLYKDYIEWLLKQNKSKSNLYWKNLLSGFNGPTILGNKKSSEVVKPIYIKESINLSIEIYDEIKQFAQANQLTVGTILQGAWGYLISQYSGNDDVVFGGVVSGRSNDLPEIDKQIGLFINTLPIRIRIKHNETVLSYLKQLQHQLISSRKYEYTALWEIQNICNHSVKKPLFENIFIFENYPPNNNEKTTEFPQSFSITNIQSYDKAPYGLTASAGELDNKLWLTISFDKNQYSQIDIQQMLLHYQQLLKIITVNTQIQLVNVFLLTPEEQHQILVKWNQTEADDAKQTTIHQLFEEQVNRTPDNVAVIFENESITYRKLNEKSNQLSHYLQKHGVRPDVPVAICVERSIDLIIALLGILKASGGYVPLDPAYPKDRLNYMFEDSKAKLLLTQTRYKPLFSRNIKIINLDESKEIINKELTSNLSVKMNPLNLSYMIYTSGSTGKPKGTMNTHIGICNRFQWLQNTYKLTEASNVLQKTPYSFDVSLWEIFWPLSVGAISVLAKPDGQKDPVYLIKLIQERNISILHFVPSMLRVFLETPQAKNCTTLKKVLTGGEVVPMDILEKFYEVLPNSKLCNGYGPTETSNGVCYYICGHKLDIQSIPIGRPIANTQAYILDYFLNPVPVGVPGELYIGGIQLGRGYINRPDLTAERFVANPFSDKPGERIYQTGDLCRWLPDGNIEYLGRIDHQVKIRGQRVEFGEIETCLKGYPQIKEAVVSVNDDKSNNKKLIAYYVAKDKSTLLHTNDLLHFLKNKLPEYMLPSVFIQIQSIPLTPSGKLDRQALPIPDMLTNTGEIILPHDNLELTLSQLWANVLNINEISINDNFFDLGGHSLLAIILINKIKQVLNISLPLSSLFSSSTVEEMADLIRKKGYKNENDVLVKIQTKGDLPPIFAAHPVGGNAMCYYELSHALGIHQPFYGLQQINTNRETSIEEMANIYVDAIRKIQPTGPYRLLGWSMGGLIALEIAYQLEKKGEQVLNVDMIDSTIFEKNQKSDESNDVNLEILGGFITDLAGRYGQEVPLSPEELRMQPAENRLKYLFDKAKESKLLLVSADLQDFTKLIKQAELNSAAAEKYQPKKVEAPITFFVVEEDKVNDNLNTWSNYTNQKIRHYVLAGDHYSIMRKPKVAVLAGILKAQLAP